MMLENRQLLTLLAVIAISIIANGQHLFLNSSKPY